ncbi:hypothetical protein OMW55_10665 [Sphingomonas sp. BN140010]|uniref:DUF998 domain-containing protein n=1 Tax=Sphingomonas arvum TaxID=2992113 RepID=A0ABT3JGP6_9SPHN|nr:hypothetical protein [Sphingomonas sp. BN140010]MCW3798263.1 hypothetical protein [Sphingomonas sp. BN140010]
MKQRVDLLTIVGWGMLLGPLLTMWHELGGHAAACAAQGGQLTSVGAYYVECTGLTALPDLVVAVAGVLVNALLALVAFALWRRARSDHARLAWWLVWVSEAFVAAGYLCFSGASGFGDLGTGPGGSFANFPHPLAIRVAELAAGIVLYVLLVRAGIRSLNEMLGTGRSTSPARRRIAHGYYATVGAAAILVGLLNPVGLVITIMSALASSFGGLAGFISIGFAPGREDAPHPFVIERSWPVFLAGAAVLAAFAVVLGRSLHF